MFYLILKSYFFPAGGFIAIILPLPILFSSFFLPYFLNRPIQFSLVPRRVDFVLFLFLCHATSIFLGHFVLLKRIIKNGTVNHFSLLKIPGVWYFNNFNGVAFKFRDDFKLLSYFALKNMTFF